MYKGFVKLITREAIYFRERWRENFGTIADVPTFTDEGIIDAMFETNKLRTSEVIEKDKIREMTRILRIKPQRLN